MKISILLATLCLSATALRAQEAPDAGTQGPWNLNDCIDYALQNNISLQKGALQIEQGQLDLSSSRLSRLPGVSASAGYNASFGRAASEDNTFKTQTLQSGSFGISASVPIFEGFSINRKIKISRLDLETAVQDLSRAREDLSINIMTLYLEVLFNKELVGVAERQLELSTQQLARSRELVDAGKQPESVFYESEALVATNSMTLTQNRNNLQLSLLNLSQALNRQSAAGFDVQQPTLDSAAMVALYQKNSANHIYDYASEHRPHILAEQLRLKSRESALKAARSAYYPSISLSGGFGTGIYGSMDDAFWSQFRHNSSEYLGVSMNIPIFNRLSARNNVRSAKLAIRNQQLALTEAEQTLRKEIEQAWYKADAAFAQYNSSDAALASARVAFQYVLEKSEAGRATVFDFNDARTRMEKAESDLLQAKYEFIFSSKILDFYMGIPLRL